MSAPISLESNELRAHCVSRPGMQDSARFFNRHGHLQAHCVSRRRPVDPTQRIHPEPRRPRLPQQPPSEPVLAVVIRMPPAPRLARPAVPLALTGRSAARTLPITGPRLRDKPLPAYPTRTLPSHAALPKTDRQHAPATRPGKATGRIRRAGSSTTRGGHSSRAGGGSLLASAEDLDSFVRTSFNGA